MLFNRDIIYIIHGNRIFTSIQERLAEYKKSFERRRRVLTKLEHYVPITGTKLIFGVQIRTGSIRGDYREMYNQLKVMKAKPSVQRFYFQFYVPDAVFFAEEVATNRHEHWPPFNSFMPNAYQGKPNVKFNNQFPMPTHFPPYKNFPRKSYREFEPGAGTSIIVKSVDNMVVNNNVQFAFPTFYNVQQPSRGYEPFGYSPYVSPYPQPVYPNPSYDPVQRLKTLFEPPAIFSKENLLSEFLKQATPKLKGVIKEDSTISSIWDCYKDLEIELFKRGLNGKPRMVNYAASLIAISLVSKERQLIFYREAQPFYQQPPLYYMAKELSKEYPVLESAKMGDLDESSWFGVQWSQTNCTPQLQVLARFSIYYKFSKDLGCEQVGMQCHRLGDCAFWKEIIGHKGSMAMIADEEVRLKKSIALTSE
eukprot:TRINITY_DN4689_c0_g1_i8.p1 TRINITY_DN4689_c0_g1~~TRINITY_DN4689_c0_g1_i8.p1  ORF type:complete len:421 (-),score=86.63 TRINITY_DN4689_c0_g1_i8:186-1448(-)